MNKENKENKDDQTTNKKMLTGNCVKSTGSKNGCASSFELKKSSSDFASTPQF